MFMISDASMHDSDRYYTPPQTARYLVGASTLIEKGRSFLDPTCGRGSLLAAVASKHGDRAECSGIDADAEVVRMLKREHPTWNISRGDILSDASIKLTGVYRSQGYDTIIGNPPFSQNGRKGVRVVFQKELINCSIAMACILRSISLFKPRLGVVSIVPESLLHAQMDADARDLLAQSFKVSLLKGLCSTTFSGARARSLIVEMERGGNSPRLMKSHLFPVKTSIKVVRGALPVHLSSARAARGRDHVRFIHSTNLFDIQSKVATCWYTREKAKGRIRGYAILMPRVGVPSPSRVVLINLREEVQLSDCVIAIQADQVGVLENIMEEIRREWRGFIDIYTGTGARYITVARLERWLSDVISLNGGQ